MRTARFVLLMGLVLGPVAMSFGADPDPARTRALARKLIDEALPQAEREAIISAHPELSAALTAGLVDDLTAGTSEEYRRIPWIWRVAVAAGKRNDADELRRLLDVALPGPSAPLDDWRAVVIGGGLINGVSLAGAWPAERFEQVLADQPALQSRWRRALEQAVAMADDSRVKTGTRYDALRMLGVEPWDRRGAQLFRYLLKGVHPELQQGAISALADVRSPSTGPALLSGLSHYSPRNRDFALDALLRDESRVSALLDAIADGRVDSQTLGPRRVSQLVQYPEEPLRNRAVKLLAKDR